MDTVIYKSPSPKDIFCYTPSIAVTSTGKLICTIDLGGDGVSKLPGNNIYPKDRNEKHFGLGCIIESVNNGRTWEKVGEFNFFHARVFTVKNDIYIIGHHGDICIIASKDDGKTWSNTVELTKNQKWHGSATNVLISKDSICLAMEQRLLIDEIKGWNVAGLSPQVLKANINADLLIPDSWSISKPITFRQVYDYNSNSQFGVPFYPCSKNGPKELSNSLHNAPIGWLEANIVRFSDPSHLWYHEDLKTFHLFLRSHTGSTNFACLLKVEDDGNNRLVPKLEKAPSGEEKLYVQLPGGHLKFFLFFDKGTNLFWLISNQSTDSMRKIETLEEVSRYELPNNERHRLQLHYSKNCVDWCFAKMVVSSSNEFLSRNYPSAIIKGEDLHIVCRSTDINAKNAQYSNIITHHQIENFRSLVY